MIDILMILGYIFAYGALGAFTLAVFTKIELIQNKDHRPIIAVLWPIFWLVLIFGIPLDFFYSFLCWLLRIKR